jgi:Fur family ferric uptake transcriptional regulator
MKPGCFACYKDILYTNPSVTYEKPVVRYVEQAEERIRAVGAKVTDSRCKVLAVLLEAGRALTHHEIQTYSGRLEDLDRVTLYRVLQWLEDKHLVHKFADSQRVWRFMADHGESKDHPHFKCERCGNVTCLDDAKIESDLHLPAGYSSNRIEMTVLGLCSVCTPPVSAKAKRAHR